MIVFEDKQRHVRVVMSDEGWLDVIFEPDIEGSKATFELEVRARGFTWWEKAWRWIMRKDIEWRYGMVKQEPDTWSNGSVR